MGSLSIAETFRCFEPPAKFQAPDNFMTKEMMSWTCLM